MAGASVRQVGELFGYSLSVFGYALTPRWNIRGKVCRGLAFFPTWSDTWLWHTRVSLFTLPSIVYGAARMCAEAELHKGDYDGPGDDPLRGKLAPLLYRRLVTEAIARRPLPDRAERIAGPNDIREAAIVCFSQSATQDDGRNAMATVMRLLQLQQHDQVDFVYFTIEHYLIKAVIRRLSERDIDLDAFCQARFGLTFDQVCFLSFAVYATAARNPGFVFTRQRYWDDSHFNISQEQWETFLDGMALNFAQFQEKAISKAVRIEGYETYALSPLKRWPLVEVDNERYIVPIARDALERVPFGFLFDMREAGLSQKAEGTLHEIRGEVFDEFAGRCLRFAKAGQQIYRAEEVVSAKRTKTKVCDWIVTDAQSVTCIEVKNKHFSLETDMRKEEQYLKKELAKSGGIVDAIVQVTETFNVLPNQSIINMNVVKHKFAVIIVHNEHVMLNFQETRSLIAEVYHEKTGQSGPDIDYYIMNDGALTALTVMLKEGYRLSDFLQWAFADSSRLELEAHHAIALFADLDSKPPERHPLWDEMFEVIEQAQAAFVVWKDSPGGAEGAEP